MSFKHGYGTIIKDGLCFYHDASNVQTYNGTGTTSYDVVNVSSGDTGANGTLQNGTAIGADSTLRDYALSSFRFDGTNDYVSFQSFLTEGHRCRPSETKLNSDGFTVIASFKFDTTGAAGIFVNDGIGQTNYYGLECGVTSAGKPSMHKMDGGTPSSVNRRSAVSNYIIKEDEWVHIAWVYTNATNSNWDIYVNAVNSGKSTSGSGGAVAYSGLSNAGGLGRQRNSNYLDGNIARVLCYDRALLQREVKQDYDVHKIRFE